jgi:hypothetical protein
VSRAALLRPSGEGATAAGAQSTRTAEPATRELAAPGPTAIDDLLGLTLRELTDRYGSAQGLSDWLDTRRRIAELARLESRSARDDGRLIARATVTTHVFGAIDRLFRTLLRETSAVIATRVAAAVRAGESGEAIARLVAAILSAEFTGARRAAVAGLDAARTGDNPPPVPAARGPGAAAAPDLHTLRTRLVCDAAPRVVDHALRCVARVAAGAPWQPAVFDAALSAQQPIRDELTHAIGVILSAHLDHPLAPHEEPAIAPQS